MAPILDEQEQERLVQMRRNQILDAATQVFADKGFHRATIRDIAKAAGIADGTIYNYFPNKPALMLGILHRINESPERPAHFAQGADVPFAQFLRVYLDHRLQTLTQGGLDALRALLPELLSNAELREVYYREVIDPTFTIAERYFKEQVERGTIRSVDPLLTSHALAGLVLGLLMLRLLGDPYLETHWNNLAPGLTDLLLKGLDLPSGDQDAHDRPA